MMEGNMMTVYTVWRVYDNDDVPEDRVYREDLEKVFLTLEAAERYRDTVKPNGNWTEGFPPEADPDYFDPEDRCFYHKGKYLTETLTYYVKEVEVIEE